MVAARFILALFAITVLLGCEVGPRSGRGLRLPAGDVARGAMAFSDLGCTRCHDVAGDPAPRVEDRARVIMVLGGEVTRVASYGELVTSIVNPSHRISRGIPREDAAEDGVSKMENFNDRMTVAQLIDLTQFLQSRYERRREPLYVP
jgi:hypothetical protein